MTRVGVFSGHSTETIPNIENTLRSWGRLLQSYQLEAFGSAKLSPDLKKWYDTIEMPPVQHRGPFSKNLATFRLCRRYIAQRSPDVLVQLEKFNTHASGLALAGRLHNVPVLTRFTGATFESYRGFRGLKRAATFLLNHGLNGTIPTRFSDRLIALGPHGKSQLRSKGATADDIDILPPPPVDDRFHPASDKTAVRESLGLPQNARLGLYVGRLSKLKGMPFLRSVIDSVTTKSDTRFVLVGDGEYKEALRSPNTDLVGAIPNEQIDRYYKAADFYLHPSPYEGVPLVILEALATGLPVTARSAGDVEFILDETVETPAEMATAILNEDFNTELRNSQYFQDEYQRTRLNGIIEHLS